MIRSDLRIAERLDVSLTLARVLYLLIMPLAEFATASLIRALLEQLGLIGR
jgi:hypothetical protein